MKNFNEHKQTLDLLDGVQHNKDVRGWSTLHEFDNVSQNKSFTSKVYKQGNKIVIALAGSTEINDASDDLAILFGRRPPQYDDAKLLYEKVKAKYPNANIESTGYSLGGTLSNLLSHHTGIKSTALAPIGSKSIADKDHIEFPYGDSNIKTYGRESDIAFNFNKNRQSGEVNLLPDTQEVPYKEGFPQHLLHNYTIYDFLQAKPKTSDFQNSILTNNIANSIMNNTGQYQQPQIGNIAELLSNFNIDQSKYSGYTNPLTGSNQIYTREDVGNMTPAEFASNEKEIDAQMQVFNGTMPTNQELQSETTKLFGGVVYVNSYTRSDGTKVRGYYRSR
jgi:hypothetical protein